MKKNSTSRKSGTNLKRLDAMTDADIDFSDIPEVTPEMFAKGVVRRGLQPITKQQLTLRLDSDVIEWFKKQGSGYQTKMNALLRAYVKEHDKAASSRARVVTRRG
ncbi:MAG: BrnA antitoxin family protein [Chloroflexota bacterium]